MSRIESEPDGHAERTRTEIETCLTTIEKYLVYASLFYESFQIREQRGVFWWSLHKLLDSPTVTVSFKELRVFLSTVPRTPYSRHKACTALIGMQDKSYISLSSSGDDGKLKLRDIQDSTLVKLEPTFFQAVAVHGAKFRQGVASGHDIKLDDLALYKKVNQFFRGPYYAEWGRFVSQVAALGQEQGGASALQIEGKLNDYSPHWVTINFLWAECLKAQLGRAQISLRFDNIFHDLNRITFVSRSNLRKTLQYQTRDMKMLTIIYPAGRPVYTITDEFHEPLFEFSRASMTLLSEFLSSLD